MPDSHSFASVPKPDILFLTAWWPRGATPNEGVFVREHARALSSAFHLHIVHLLFHKTTTVRFPRIEVNEHNNSIGHHVWVDVYSPIRRFGFHPWLVRRAYAGVIRKLRKEHDIKGIHLNVRSHLTQLAFSIQETKDLPLVYTEHFSFYQLGIPNLPKEKRLMETEKMRLWLNDPRIKVVLPVSQAMAKAMIEQYRAPAFKVHVVRNAVGSAFECVERPKRSEIQILAAAVWSGPKRPMLMLEALDMLPAELRSRIQLIIAGNGDYLEAMKMKATSMRGFMSIDFLGFIDSNTLAAQMKNADFLLHPTSFENAPVVISEALCCGLPVLSMKVNGIPEMITEENGILVEPENATALRAGIERMCRDLGNFDRAEMARTAKQLYGMEAVGKQLSEHVYKLCE